MIRGCYLSQSHRQKKQNIEFEFTRDDKKGNSRVHYIDLEMNTIKSLLLTGLLTLIVAPLWSQTSDLIKYQAVLRNATGSPIQQKSVTLRFSILQTTPNGTSVYEEKHTVMTNLVGLVNLHIGAGFDKVGTIGGVDWGNDEFFLQVELDDDLDGSFDVMGTSQLTSVPYSLMARDVENKQDLKLSNDSLTITGTPAPTVIDMSAFRDNTDNQQLIYQNSQLVLFRQTLNDTIDLSPIVNQGLVNASSIAQIQNTIATDTLSLLQHLANDQDMDNTNELQTLSLNMSNDTLEISGSGSKVSLSQYLDNTDAQTLATGFNTGNSRSISISNGNSVNINVADQDSSNTNEIQDLTLSGHSLSITNNASATTVDLSGYAQDNDNQILSLNQSGTTYTLGTSNTSTTVSIDVADGDADATNEIQDLSLSGNDLTITNNGSATTIDLSSYLDNTDAQNLSNTTSGTNRTINISGGTGTTIDVADNDNDGTNEIQDLSLSGNNLTITNNGSATTIDLSGYLDNTDTQNLSNTTSGTNRTINISGGTGTTIDVADNDNDGTNEIQDLSLSGNNLTITNNGSATTIDLSGYLDNTDAQNLSNTTSGTNRTINISGGTGTTIDVADIDNDTLNELQNLSSTTSGTNRTINISSGTGTTIDVADNDNDGTNEIQDLSLSGNNLTITNNGSATTIDLSGYLDNTDAQNLSNTTSGTNRTINISGGTGTTIDVADNDNDANNEIQNLGSSASGTNRTITVSGGGSSTTIDVADNDNDGTNEIQDLSLSGNDLTITNNGSATTIDLSSYLDNTDAQNLSNTTSGTNRTINISGGTGTTIDVADNDNDGTNEIQDLSLSGNNLTITNNGSATTIDLSGYLDNTDTQNLSNTTSGTNRTINISGGTGTTIDVADNDNDGTNEIQDLSLSGNNLTITNNGSATTIDLSGYLDNTDTQNLSNTTSGTNRTINISGGTGTTIDVADNDNDATNEMQTLTFQNDSVIISGGNGVDLSSFGSEDQLNDGDSDTRVEVEASTDEDVIRFTAGGTERMTISGANVGIANSSPSYNLDVTGTARTSSLRVGTNNLQYGASVEVADRQNIMGTSNPNLFIGESGSDYFQIRYQTASDYGHLFTPGTRDIILEAGGDVGIGTTSPAADLDVNGTTRTSNLTMTTGASAGTFMVGNGSGVVAWTDPSTLGVNFVEDADGDTRILTESSADNDQLRMHIAGTEYLRIRTATNGATIMDIRNETNTYLGGLAGRFASVNLENVGVGYLAHGNGTVTGSYNAAMGYAANYSLSSGGYNIAIGQQSNFSGTTGSENVGIGRNANYRNTTANYNVGVGSYSNYNATGAGNTAVGYHSGNGVTSNTGIYNVSMGYFSAYERRGSYNVGVGPFAGYMRGGGTGSYNTALGAYAGYENTGGTNTFLGAFAGYNANSTGSGNVFIGYNAGYNETGSNLLYIDNTTTSTPLIYGNFSSNALTFNGTVTSTGLVTTPSIRITGSSPAANDVLVSDASGNGTWQPMPSKQRAYMISPRDFDATDFNANVTHGTVGGFSMPCLNFADGGNGNAQLSIPVPSDWASGNITWRLLYTSSTNTGNFNFTMWMQGMAVGDDLGGSPSTSGALTLSPPATANYLQEATKTETFINTTDKVVHLYLRRNGSNAGDTSTGIMRVVGIIMEYND